MFLIQALILCQPADANSLFAKLASVSAVSKAGETGAGATNIGHWLYRRLRRNFKFTTRYITVSPRNPVIDAMRMCLKNLLCVFINTQGRLRKSYFVTNLYENIIVSRVIKYFLRAIDISNCYYIILFCFRFLLSASCFFWWCNIRSWGFGYLWMCGKYYF